MSKHNYSQYSKKNESHNQSNPSKKSVVEEPVVKPNPVKMEQAPVAPVEPAINPVQETTSGVQPSLVQETVETVTLPEMITGTVSNCAKLNVRATPSTNAEIVCVLDVMSEIQIDAAKSDNEWLKICTATGIEGYCMRKFVDTHL